eukprot:TRINITY_DN3607_c0_g1_i2.p1 TRINITY_DN3607_c0_g1~~TRINITY_DN3607_c0_g1_i2.p1  ORF type:complete len:178 (-),score=29.22 TRINITY_DN3607_c0_g1_i2:84-617(-)
MVMFDVDANGKPKDVDENLLEIHITGNGRKFGAVIERTGLGSYIGRFADQTPGIYAATVVYDKMKSVKQKVVINERPSARCSKVEGLQKIVASGKPFGFSIISNDIHGNRIGCGGDPWEVRLKGPTQSSEDGLVKVNDHKDGRYTVELVVPSPGSYTVTVTIGEDGAKGSPFTVKAE